MAVAPLLTTAQEAKVRVLPKRVILLSALLSSPLHAQTQGLFSLPVPFPGSGQTVTADFNGDGKPDLICADGTVLLGKGDGTFTLGVTVTAGGQFYNNLIVTADFNGDGKPDLALANFSSSPVTASNKLIILLGNGDGTFQPAKTIQLAAPVSAIFAVDVNGDGKPDMLAVTNQPGFSGLLVALGKGDGTFSNGVVYPAGNPSSPALIATGDFNGDHRLDVAVVSATSTALLLGNGDGTFQSPSVPILGKGGLPASIVAADFDGDGKLDLAIGDFSEPSLSPGPQVMPGLTYVSFGNGDGTFQPPVLVGTGTNLVAGNLSNNGKLKLVAESFPFLSVFQGNPDKTFTLLDSYLLWNKFNSLPQVPSLTVADFNADGKLDLAVDNDLFLGNGDGSFQGAEAFLGLPAPNGSAVVADFNHDGFPDIAAFTSTNHSINTSSVQLSILLNNGKGQLSLAHAYPSTASINPSVAADLNGDGNIDLIGIVPAPPVIGVPPTSATLGVMLGNGDGSFGPVKTLPGVVPPVVSGMAIADLNGDKKPDLIVIAGSFSGTTLSGSMFVFLGNGDGTFAAPVSYFAGTANRTLVAADFNGDGTIDVAVGSSNGVALLLGNGDGTFKPATFPFPVLFNVSLTADLNGDGKLDLVGNLFNPQGPSSSLQIFLGKGDGTFTALPPGPNLGLGASLLAADFNRDGKLDLVASGLTVSELLGNGDGTFSAPIGLIPFGAQGTGGAFAVADFNGDKRPDIAMTAAGDSGLAGLALLFNAVGPDFSISASALAPSTIAPGSSATSTVTVGPIGGFSGGVALSCTGMPSGANCSFVPSSLPNGSGTATVTVATTAASQTFVLPLGLSAPMGTGVRLTSYLLGLLAAAFMVNLFLRHRNQQPRWVLVFILGVLLSIGMVVAACGGGSGRPGAGGGNSGTPAGTYTITVSGTFTSGSTTLTHDTKLTLIVQ
jgi:hypothetical protein